MFASHLGWKMAAVAVGSPVLAGVIMLSSGAMAQNGFDTVPPDKQSFEMESPLLEKLKQAVDGPPQDGVELMMDDEAFPDSEVLPEDAVDTLEQEGVF